MRTKFIISIGLSVFLAALMYFVWTRSHASKVIEASNKRMEVPAKLTGAAGETGSTGTRGKSPFALPVVVTPVTLPSQGLHASQEKTAVMQAALILKGGNMLDAAAHREAVQTLSHYGDNALVIMLDELKEGNRALDDKSLRQRMALIDILGLAAETKPFVRDELKRFSMAPLLYKKDKSMMHKDFIDRLETFEYVSRNDKDTALHYIKTLSNRKIQLEYSKHYVVGQKMKGRSEDDAVLDLLHFLKKT